MSDGAQVLKKEQRDKVVWTPMLINVLQIPLRGGILMGFPAISD
jgi:hypothetical protein